MLKWEMALPKLKLQIKKTPLYVISQGALFMKKVYFTQKIYYWCEACIYIIRCAGISKSWHKQWWRHRLMKDSNQSQRLSSSNLGQKLIWQIKHPCSPDTQLSIVSQWRRHRQYYYKARHFVKWRFPCVKGALLCSSRVQILNIKVLTADNFRAIKQETTEFNCRQLSVFVSWREPKEKTADCFLMTDTPVHSQRYVQEYIKSVSMRSDSNCSCEAGVADQRKQRNKKKHLPAPFHLSEAGTVLHTSVAQISALSYVPASWRDQSEAMSIMEDKFDHSFRPSNSE